MSNRELFKATYREELIKSHTKNPEYYGWPMSEMDQVLERMNAAIDRGSFQKDSRAFRATCKRLGINFTYRDIETFIGSET